MGFFDLPAVVAEHEALRPVQDADAARGQRRSMTARRDAFTRRLDPDEGNRRVGEEGPEHPDRVRPAADARDDRVGQGALLGEKLRARLLADDALQERY